MKNNRPIKIGLSFSITILFIFLTVTPIVIGYNVKKPNKATIVENYDCYHISEIPNFIQHCISKESNIYDNLESEKIRKTEETMQPLDGPPMESPWPVYCHDVRHTGRSPYSTVDTWEEIWRFRIDSWPDGGPSVDDNGIVYIGSYYLDAVYPNGTLKWKFDTNGIIKSCPAIDEEGTIYVGNTYSDSDFLYALNPNGTLKWKYWVGRDIFSSPTIGDDGTIYFGSGGDYPPTGSINAVYPNGSTKWEFNVNHVVYSSPAIGYDGTIYCGSHDTYLYALYPNNGTVKWKYKTGNWIRVSPCIDDDGTIYVVSLDNYLHAVNPDGSLKWKTDVRAGTSPTIGQDGTIYCGYKKLHAINPMNGSVKWTFNVGGTMRGGTPCNSIDGTIYVGTSDGGEIIAVNTDGTLKWRKSIGECESPPAIGEDGTVYIGGHNLYLHAFGWCELEADANGPYYGQINESIQFQGSAKGGYRPHSYHWDFGDGNDSYEEDPTHIYTEPGNYTVVFTVTDNTSNTSSDTSWALIKETNYPPDKPDIDGPTSVKVGHPYNYSFNSTDPDGNDIWYHICWGDKEIIYIYGPYHSGEELTLSYTWFDKGTYPITCWARDVYDEVSDTATLEVEVPRTRATTYLWYQWFLERFPLLEKILSLIKMI